MNRITRIMMVLSAMYAMPVCASENAAKKLDAQKTENQNYVPVSGYNFLQYPNDVHIEVDKSKLPQGVIRLGNTFMKPKEMDPGLIHRTLIFVKKNKALAQNIK